MNNDEKSISLVLGSGGARGFAHIGIIRFIEEIGLTIKSISGSSIGAVVGGVYAAGKLQEFTEWVIALEGSDVFRLMDLTIGSPGFVKGDRVMKTLKDLVGDIKIEDLPISFTAVASDIEKQREVWLNQGCLFDALRASIAIPMLLTPYEIRGRHLLDGGLMNPVPIAPTFRDSTDFTIAVNLGGKPNQLDQYGKLTALSVKVNKNYKEKIKNFLAEFPKRDRKKTSEQWSVVDVVAMYFEAMQNKVAQLKLAAYSPDFLIEIPRDAASTLEFYRAKELIELGYQLAQEVLSSFKTKG